MKVTVTRIVMITFLLNWRACANAKPAIVKTDNIKALLKDRNSNDVTLTILRVTS